MLEKFVIKNTAELMRCSETMATSLQAITAYSVSNKLLSDSFTKDDFLAGGAAALEMCCYTLIWERCAESAPVVRWKGKTIRLGEKRLVHTDSGESEEYVSVIEMTHNNAGKKFFVQVITGESGSFCVPYEVAGDGKIRWRNTMCAVVT